MSYYMHRIQKADGTFQKGIEVYDTLDAAILSFWGRMKLGYGKSNNTFVSCKITDDNGNIVEPYNMTWLQDGEQTNVFFLHHIRKDGETVDKNIDIIDSLDYAYGNLAEMMEYGYNNPKHPDVSYVYCMITDLMSGGMVLYQRSWVKPVEPTPEPET